MFEFLKEINEKLYERYLTLERNIKAASNSFYDAYLDLLEHFVKIVAHDCGIALKAKATCGDVLKIQEVKNYFIEELKVSKYTFAKMQDYTLKVNEHKHKGEKKIEIETIISYMNVLYSITSAYAKNKSIALGEFDVDYYAVIFGKLEKENNEFKEITDELKSKIDGLTEAINQTNRQAQQRTASNIQPQAERRNQTAVLANFVKRASKKYHYFGGAEYFRKEKMIVCVWMAALLLVGLIATIISSVAFKLYSTFTFVENIWMILGITMLSFIFKAQRDYDCFSLSSNNMEKYVYDADGVPKCTNKLKIGYRIMRWLTYISVAGNIICLWTLSNSTVLSVFGTIFELGFGVLSFVSVSEAQTFFGGYNAVYFTGRNESNTETVTLVHNLMENKLYLLEDYEKRYPFEK